MKGPRLSETQQRAAQASAVDSATLADRINVLHAEARGRKTQALLKAHAAGELLLTVKRGLRHGEYLEWLEANFKGSQGAAWRYTRVAQRWETIANYSPVNNLSITEALKLARFGYKGGA